MRGLAIASAIAVSLLGTPLDAEARVVRVVVERRELIGNGSPFGAAGAYERITGRVYFAFDPDNPANRRIVDLALAPRNAHGEVEAWSEFVMLVARDPARRSGVTLVDVVNRGGMTVGVFNLDRRDTLPSSAGYYGDAFLLRQGYTVMMLGWQWDILPGTAGLHFTPPVAGDAAHPISGMVRSDITVDAPAATIPLGHRVGASQALGYAVADTLDPANVLTVRDAPDAPRQVIPREEWRFARGDESAFVADPRSVWLRGGFQAGRIYEVTYRATNPVIVGTGLAAMRDVISYLKHDPASLAPTRWGIAYGVSQTGRFLRHFMYDGFNTDEHGRVAYDGIFAHAAGAGRGSFNHRFAQPSRDAQPYTTFFYPTDLFPFTSRVERDQVTGARDGLRTHVPQGRRSPKVFFVDGGYEYWGRGSSLTHTTVDAAADVPLLPTERRYLLASAQHSSPASFPPTDQRRMDAARAWRGNPMDQRLALRALLMDLTDWVRSGRTPPPSSYPTIAAHALVPAESLVMPAIPGVRMARMPYVPRRLSFGDEWTTQRIVREPPILGAPYVVLVPATDSLGNERGGIRSVELRVPVATYLPWQLRAVPPTDRLASFNGTFVPLPRTEVERKARGDSRPSLEMLYPSRDAFLARVDSAAAMLVSQRFMLDEDRRLARARMAASWDWVMSQ